jgi:hypothetical protein
MLSALLLLSIAGCGLGFVVRDSRRSFRAKF